MTSLRQQAVAQETKSKSTAPSAPRAYAWPRGAALTSSPQPHTCFTASTLRSSYIGKGGASSSLAVRKAPAPVAAAAAVSRRLAPAAASESKEKPTEFRRFYERGDLPIQVAFDGAQRKVQWKVMFDYLDYHHYLPIFFDGIRERKVRHSSCEGDAVV